MTRRLLISIALGAAELAWDALRKAPGRAWAVAHAWLVVRAGERAKPKTIPCAVCSGPSSRVAWVGGALQPFCEGCVFGRVHVERPTGEMAVALDAEEPRYHACRIARSHEVSLLLPHPLRVRCIPEDGGCGARPERPCVFEVVP